MLSGILTFVQGVLVVLAVFFAVRTINLSRELKGLQMQSVLITQNYARLQGLANETVAYNQKYPNPTLTRILQGH
jgi:hypothetical protein